MNSISGARFVVTGGGGFLGFAIAQELRRQGAEVVSVARGRYPKLDEIGVVSVQADIARDVAALIEACQGATAVFHTAAKVEMWGQYHEFFRINVEGTRNVIQACKDARVSRLIFTSSPSVVAGGVDLCGVDESTPYPPAFHAAYPATKAIAEQEVLAANCAALATISLRPHLIFGPGDTNLEPLVVARARAGRLVRIGDGRNLADFTYIDDCVAAHLCAMDALDQNPACRGKAYFISQGVPIPLWAWVDAALKRNGLPSVRRSVPRFVAKTLGTLFEGLARVVPIQPPFTRFLADEMATSHYFDISAAKRDLGFRPQKTDLLTW